MIVLETPRLVLRHFELADAPFALALLNEPSFLANVGDKEVRTIADAERYLETGPIASYARHGHGLYIVLERESGLPVGMCGLLKREQRGDVDIGYAFRPPWWGRGYAYESAAAVLARAGSVHGYARIVAFVSPGNEPSIRVLAKLGFTAAGETSFSPDAPKVLLFQTTLPDPHG